MGSLSNTHNYSSWGRTRRPKNVNGADSTAHAVSTTAYFTENQRFLHIQCAASSNVTKIELYYHASEVWTILHINDGDGSWSQAVVAASTMRIYEIAGADKVRVTHAGNSGDAANKCYLSLSTF